jgi:alpha-D-ribose 1-methylphosphonate 5-triphosphate synthase subunit PhnH
MIAASHELAGGFAEPVLDSQSVFRTLLDAMANPAQVMALPTAAVPPQPLSPGAGAVALALCDGETTVFLDESLAGSPAVRRWIEFHTGAPIVADRESAAFAFLSNSREAASFDLFSQGTQEYPDRSATLVMEVASLGSGETLVFEGPGIRERAALAVSGLSRNFASQWKANGARFPRGIDIVLVAPQGIACLPRTARLTGMEG